RFLHPGRGGGYLPYCGLTGGILLLAADLAARTVGGGVELPVSIFTVTAGVPVLVLLLCTGGRRRL
ncbi:MAG: iron chelate uptake ABC transporter family permease subunit, partial [Clostridia bacterium]|nr:iron chelate uptake ABC transporter family permease subunit [Clostridia bacterium]